MDAARLEERLPGERLTLESWVQSLGAMDRALGDGATLDDASRVALSERRARLEAKIDAQAERVSTLEARLAALEPTKDGQ